MREVTLHSSPDSMGGAKRFPNTRVPVSLFFLNLAEGVGIDRFCLGYPRVDPDDCREYWRLPKNILRNVTSLPSSRNGVEGVDNLSMESTCFGEVCKRRRDRIALKYAASSAGAIRMSTDVRDVAYL